jgi:hypothetical protein
MSVATVSSVTPRARASEIRVIAVMVGSGIDVVLP